MIAKKPITLTIDGKKCAGEEGQTILQVARANEVYIPTLCHLEHLSPWGGCRICICEIAGSPKVVPACSTPAADGSAVTTNSDRLKNLRRVTLELLFSERNHICPMCPSNKGDCGLQHQGYLHGIDSIRFPYLYPALPVDLSSRYFGLDHNRCILCTRCVRTCDEIEGVHTLDISHRGAHNRVVVDLGGTFGQSDTCTLCGACVAACPTGALFDKAAAFRGPLASCEKVKTTCLECPVGCGLLVYTRENRIVNVWGDPDSPVNHGHLCRKGRYETWAEPRERILHPLVRKNGTLVRATWDETKAAIADATKNLPANQKALLVSPRLTHEAGKAVKRFAEKFGAVGMFVAENEAALCAETNGSTLDLNHLGGADAILVLGAQPSRDHGVVAARIRAAVRKGGAKLLIFHARKSDLDAYADIGAHVVSLEHSFWDRVADVLKGVQHPVLVYGPNAMTPIGVTVMERLIRVFEAKATGQPPHLIALPTHTNSLALAAAGIEPVEDVGPWIDQRALKFLHVLAGDEPDGGAGLLDERYVPELLDGVECIVLQAGYQSALTERAHVVLPAAVWSEKSGTVTNLEGTTLSVRAVLPKRGEARDDESILEELYS